MSAIANAAGAAAAVHYPFAVPPEGEPVEVAPGVHWLRLPLPFALDHVNLWLLEDAGGWTLIDTGVANDRLRALWRRLIDRELRGRPVRRLIATHFHPDHLGLAGWLCAELGCELWASRSEWLMGRMLALDTSPEHLAVAETFYRAAGLAEEELDVQRRRGNHYRSVVVPPPSRFRRLRAGDELKIGGHRLRVIIGEGHSPEQVTLFAPDLNLLIAGDQVLPRISPNVAVWPSLPDDDPLADFLGSLGCYDDLPADVLVLPSHDRPFTGLHARLAELRHHHAQRLAEALAACARPQPASAVMRELFRRSLDGHQTVFAIGETLAHLNRLIASGDLAREQGGDGLLRYRRL